MNNTFFHMPLFIFISGYFTKPTTIDKLKSSALKILEALAISTLFRWIYTRTFPHTLSELLTPTWALWYHPTPHIIKKQ